jgi:hypothetical protein
MNIKTNVVCIIVKTAGVRISSLVCLLAYLTTLSNLNKSRSSFVSIVTTLMAGRSEFDSRQRPGYFLLTTAPRPALGSTQPPVQWVRGAFSLGVKRPSREADHSPPFNAKVKNTWSYISTPLYVFMA